MRAAAQVRVERGQDRVPLGAQQAAHAVDVGVQTGLREPVHGHRRELADAAGPLDGGHPLHERRRRGDVPQPHAGTDVLGERGDVDRPAAVVERSDRRRHLLSVEGQIDVAIVLPHRHAAAGGDLEHRLTTRRRRHPAERVLKGRHRVDRLDALARLRRLAEAVFQRVGQHAVAVRLHAADVGAEPAQDAERAGVGEVLHQHHVAGIDQRFGDQEVGLARPGAEQDVVGVDRESAGVGKPVRQPLAQRRIAERMRIVRQAAAGHGQLLPQALDQLVERQRVGIGIGDSKVVPRRRMGGAGHRLARNRAGQERVPLATPCTHQR